jgi:hypothetical protein
MEELQVVMVELANQAGNATFYIDESEDVNHPHTRGVGGTIVGDMNVMLPPKSGQRSKGSLEARAGCRQLGVYANGDSALWRRLG